MPENPHPTKRRRVAVITGAANGIGFYLTKACLERGMSVVMADKSAQGLQEASLQLAANFRLQLLDSSKIYPSTEQKIFPSLCDVASQEALVALAEESFAAFGQVDWLFNNAGISGPLKPVWELTAKEVQQVFDVNLFGVIHGLRAFLPGLFAQTQRSHIINICSLYGLCSGSQMAAYAMSKHALLALSESLYFDLERLNKAVDVSVACPSFTQTALLAVDSTAKNLKSQEKFQESLSNLLERSRPAEDVAQEIIAAVERGVFYILPDKEVKDYCAQRTEAILQQQTPHQHSLERILRRLAERAGQ